MEYPIEVPAGAGRIVGEIHIDHVRVNYQKNAFEYDTPDWKKVERLLRGEGPLLPKSARELGYLTNTSPLARLISGYRRNVPGKDYLTPVTGWARSTTRPASGPSTSAKVTRNTRPTSCGMPPSSSTTTRPRPPLSRRTPTLTSLPRGAGA